mmetsp:Transcript_31858/g.68235  ORF Transcript_31858/g.68235 Transcript_31858/m.68235 type:complete len:230 (-) Transcript_31858:843-1532(-)
MAAWVHFVPSLDPEEDLPAAPRREARATQEAFLLLFPLHPPLPHSKDMVLAPTALRAEKAVFARAQELIVKPPASCPHLRGSKGHTRCRQLRHLPQRRTCTAAVATATASAAAATATAVAATATLHPTVYKGVHPLGWLTRDQGHHEIVGLLPLHRSHPEISQKVGHPHREDTHSLNTCHRLLVLVRQARLPAALGRVPPPLGGVVQPARLCLLLERPLNPLRRWRPRT